MTKIARLEISKEFFEMFLRGELFMEPNTHIRTNAPKDLEVVGLVVPERWYGYPGTLEIFVRSETFAEVVEGAVPPVIEPFTYTLVKHD
jgi:hypothetical protein